MNILPMEVFGQEEANQMLEMRIGVDQIAETKGRWTELSTMTKALLIDDDQKLGDLLNNYLKSYNIDLSAINDPQIESTPKPPMTGSFDTRCK
jgi:hypothetical protein